MSVRMSRVGIFALDAWQGMLAAHLANAKEMGLFRYLLLKNFIHHNTDGPHNPYALVYDRKRVEHSFSVICRHSNLQAIHARTAAASTRSAWRIANGLAPMGASRAAIDSQAPPSSRARIPCHLPYQGWLLVAHMRVGWVCGCVGLAGGGPEASEVVWWT
jgi:hypothetical protein